MQVWQSKKWLILLGLLVFDTALLFTQFVDVPEAIAPISSIRLFPTATPTITPTPTPSRMSVALTGVTAISRGVEAAIASHSDPIYPARGVMDLLKTADITVVDSENPFFDDCVPEREGIVLCGKTRSIASLQAIGADIIDLTGNHQNDYGPEKNLESIGHLEAAGFEYFGGGKNEANAAEILYHEVNGTTLAFLGYAYFDSQNGPQYRSLAYGNRPGANFYSEEKMQRDVDKAKSKADVVIVDYQFIEKYSYEPLDEQVEVFRKTAEAGADVVVGVQSHQPQRVEFCESSRGTPTVIPGSTRNPEKHDAWIPDQVWDDKQALIFYGLGNFFFDQMWSHETRQGIIPWLIFEDGKLISLQIYTTLLHDYSQPRLTEGEERIELLKEILPKPCHRPEFLELASAQPPNLLPCLK